MRYIRFFIFLVFAIFYHFIFVLPVLFLAFLLKKEEVLYFVYHWFWKISFWILGIKVTPRGLENIPPPPYIIAPNHTSYIDPPLLIMLVPHRLKAMAKKGVFYLPIVGQAIALASFIPVDRASAVKASLAFRRGEELLEKGKPLLVFPEGTRTHNGEIGRFKEGVCRLSMKTGVPVVPVVIKGGFEVMSRMDKIPRPGRVVVEFLSPIHPQEFSSASAMNHELKRAIENVFKED